MKSFLQLAFEKRTVKSAIRVSIIVGIILNFINQGDVIIALDIQKIAFSKIALTFVVPYLVSTYSSVLTKQNLKNNKE